MNKKEIMYCWGRLPNAVVVIDFLTHLFAVSTSSATKSIGRAWFLNAIEKHFCSVISKTFFLKWFFLDARFPPFFRFIKISVWCPESTSLICEIKIFFEDWAEEKSQRDLIIWWKHKQIKLSLVFVRTYFRHTLEQTYQSFVIPNPPAK